MPSTRRDKAPAPIRRPDLLAELLRRRDADQAGRTALTDRDPAAVARLAQMDAENTAWLKTIVATAGWPGRALVGDEGAHAAWLLVQHADRDVAFQYHCLQLMERAAAAGDAAWADVAHLSDRVALAGGGEQIYGTQISARDGRYVACRLRDPATVDARRAAAGLGTLAAQLAHALDTYGPPAPAPMRCPLCGARIEVWLPELGGRTAVTCASCGRVTTVRAHMRQA